MLSIEALAAGHQNVHFESLDSTNEEALRRVESGVSTPLWISADQQEAGRGREQRKWISPAGNLHISCLLSQPAEPRFLPNLSFVAGVALVEALEETTGRGGIFRLKWPNDILVYGEKLAGILLEVRNQAQTQHVVIGWGVNIEHRFAHAPYPTTSLKDLGYMIRVSELACALSASFTAWLALFQQGYGFAAIRHAWLMRAHGLNEPVGVRLPNQSLQGIFRGIDDQGRFALEQNGTIQFISAGDIFFSHAKESACD